ncbi:hypothetical protein TNCV_639311 [Trichonephila clavipes]|nr:hypothetical protein TNCV_639311 [Trichonephila clavipes]
MSTYENISAEQIEPFLEQMITGDVCEKWITYENIYGQTTSSFGYSPSQGHSSRWSPSVMAWPQSWKASALSPDTSEEEPQCPVFPLTKNL